MPDKTLRIERAVTIALMALFAAAGVYALAVARDVVLALKAFASALLLPLPRLAAVKLRLRMGAALPALWCLFIVMAILGGSFLDFYYVFPLWDKMLHLASGALSAVAAFWVYELILDRLVLPEKKKSALLLNMVLSFVTACAVALLWEVYEFTVDRLFDLNCQRYKEDPMAYSGLMDTMWDMICGGGAGLAAAYILYAFKRRRLPPPDMQKLENTPSD